ncbi:MAG: energy transducer TonB, partial [Micropepsaceae bacterium]
TREYLFETVEYQPAIRDGEPVDYCRTELVLWFLEELQAERQAQIEADRERTGSVQQRDYPTESVRLREEGLVIVNVCVAADGSIDDVRLVETSGNPRLDNATIRMVMSRFRYNPATQQGAPVRHCQNQPVRWALPPQ